MADRIPLILFGDGPRLQSGLARIARDLALRLVADADSLGIWFAQVGVDYAGGWSWQPWDFYGFLPTEKDQGRGAVAQVVQEIRQRQDDVAPIVWAIMDPGRVYDLTRLAHGLQDPEIDTDRFWGYFPIDSHNLHRAVGGPAAAAMQQCERVLAYGSYGAGVIRKTLQAGKGQTPVQHLPHGIETRIFHPHAPLSGAVPGFQRWIGKQPKGQVVIGCVATNQARKDYGLLFATIRSLKHRGLAVSLWVQTDVLTKAWAIGELAHTCGLTPAHVAVSTESLTDDQLAAQYAASDLTIAPGLGEGFGYPIVESLACGTPVVHGKYAGGVELIPEPRWLVEPVTYRLEGLYAVQRPVFDPRDVADAVERVLQWQHDHRAEAQAFCAGSVAHLDWQHLWPRWRSWITAGLRPATEDLLDPPAVRPIVPWPEEAPI